MSEERPRIGKKGAGRRLAQKFAKVYRKQLSKELLELVFEVSERNKQGALRIE